MIWTFKIQLLAGLHAEQPWIAEIEIDSGSTLEGLNLAIHAAIDFDNDHM
jgi:hypothetical protein